MKSTVGHCEVRGYGKYKRPHGIPPNLPMAKMLISVVTNLGPHVSSSRIVVIGRYKQQSLKVHELLNTTAYLSSLQFKRFGIPLTRNALDCDGTCLFGSRSSIARSVFSSFSCDALNSSSRSGRMVGTLSKYLC